MRERRFFQAAFSFATHRKDGFTWTCSNTAHAVWATGIMAIVWKSRGTVGPGSLGAGKSMPLDVIEKRLTGFRIFCHGERPRTMLPQSDDYYVHIMIEVTDDDPQPRPDRFPRPGFYQVVGLRVPNAGFLFESPSIPARAHRVAR